MLVPGERDSETVKVELQMPRGLLPFSYEDPAGWKRSLAKAADGSVERVVWTGSAPSDGFTEFSFLAGTPDTPGELQFKALQTYADGTVVRWIGAPDSDNPAAVVKVKRERGEAERGRRGLRGSRSGRHGDRGRGGCIERWRLGHARAHPRRGRPDRADRRAAP